MYLRLLLSLFALSAFSLQAQVAWVGPAYFPEKVSDDRAFEAISLLHEGHLVVRLPSLARKIAEYERLLENPNLLNSQRDPIAKNLQLTIEERDRSNLLLMEAFENQYTFSQVWYVYDSASVALREKQWEGIFLNSKLEPDPNIQFNPGGDFLTARIGNTKGSQGLYSIVLGDSELEDFRAPFPYYVQLSSLFSILDGLILPQNADRRTYNKVTARLQSRLVRFYETAERKRIQEEVPGEQELIAEVQKDSRSYEHAVNQLFKGHLILRLPSKVQEISMLERQLATTLRDNKREKIEYQLKFTVSERDRINRLLVEAFEQEYTFSQVWCVYDTASIALRNAQWEGIFLNSELEPDSSIRFNPEGEFFTARIGNTDGKEGAKALIITDSQLRDYQAPFPYFVELNSFKWALLSFFTPGEADRRRLNRVAADLQHQLTRYQQSTEPIFEEKKGRKKRND